MPSEFHLTANADSKAVELLSLETGFSRQLIKQAMAKGAIWIKTARGVQRLRKATAQLTAGDEVFFYYNNSVLARTPPTPELLADCGDYSVWHKPSGMLSQGSKWGDHCALPRWVEAQYRFDQGTPQRNGFLVHRLDKAAQGLMLVAHTKKAAQRLSALFESRELDKRYRAHVHGRFLPHVYGQRHVCELPVDGKSARTGINLLAYHKDKNQSLLELRIHTGRKHQIRVHLSSLGYPIVGDRLYGSDWAKTPDENLQLCAHSLAFHCPLKDQPVRFEVKEALKPQA